MLCCCKICAPQTRTSRSQLAVAKLHWVLGGTNSNGLLAPPPHQLGWAAGPTPRQCPETRAAC
eukprot:9097480-Alexandrium_andersonii.AAC.1